MTLLTASMFVAHGVENLMELYTSGLVSTYIFDVAKECGKRERERERERERKQLKKYLNMFEADFIVR